MGDSFEAKEKLPHQKLILALVGMPGSGKSEASLYLSQKGIPFLRFGEITDEGLKELGLPYTSENERMFREKIRQELGMGAYAIKAKPKIQELLGENDVIAIDGLYSWEEYTFLKREFPGLLLIHIFSEPEKRYQRLSQRKVRPVSIEEGYARDVAEIERLNKGGPIAIADFMIENDSTLEDLHQKIGDLLARLNVEVS